MRLVTFLESGAQRLGAFAAADARIVDLQKAHVRLRREPSPALASLQALIEAGEAGLATAREALSNAALDGDDSIAAASATLLAPLPHPPQIRDFLCFEKHLIQAFKQARRVRAAGAADPEAAIREMEEKGVLTRAEVEFRAAEIKDRLKRTA